MLLPIVPGNGHDGQIPFGVCARVAFLFKECTVVRNPPAPPCCKLSAYNEFFLFVKWEAQKMHSAICKGVLKVGFWEAQKGLKRRRKKLHSATGEAQFREDFRLHLAKVCGQNNSVVVSEIFQNSPP